MTKLLAATLDMPPRLILNADDFGLTPGINRAIAELHAAGCLTSATLMANGPAFEDAVRIALTHPALGVGCHIVLVDGLPVLPAESLPTLCPNRTSFQPKLSGFQRDLLRGRIDTAEVERECLAQLYKLQATGLRVTHADTHKHTHIFPQVARPLLNACDQANVKAVRYPFEPASNEPFSTSNLMQRLKIHAAVLLQPRFRTLPQIRSGAIQTTDGTFGVSATGHLNDKTLADLLHSLPGDGTYELLCHPGYNDADLDAIPTRLRVHREIERNALLREVPKFLSIQNPPALISYADLEA